MSYLPDDKTLPNKIDRLKAAKTSGEKDYLNKVLIGEEQRRILRTAKESEQTFTMADFWIMKGWVKEDGTLAPAPWKYDTGARKEAVKFLVENVLKKDPRDISALDFQYNRLSAVRKHYEKIHSAINDAFPELNLKPWHMRSVRGWEEKENRIGAIKEVVEIKNKDPTEITTDDIISLGYQTMFHYYKRWPLYSAIIEAYPEREIKPWHMKIPPDGTWDDTENRINATRELAAKLGKDPVNITTDDFKNQFGSTVLVQKAGGIYNVIREAFPEKDIKFWEMTAAPIDAFEIKDNRISAMHWLVDKLKKSPTEISTDDIEQNGLRSIVSNHRRNIYDLVVEAFPEKQIKPWQMKHVPMGTWENRENRVGAIQEVAIKLGKRPLELTDRDLTDAGYDRIINYYDGLYSALADASTEISIKPWHRDKHPNGVWGKKEYRVEAVKELVQKLGKEPTELSWEDLEENGLIGLANFYHNTYNAVNEAFPEKQIKPWQMKYTPRWTWDSKENRVEAIKSSVLVIGKDVHSLNREDFSDTPASTVVYTHYLSLWHCLHDAGLVAESREQFEDIRNLKRKGQPT